jgi:hypothetical protein
MSFIVVCMHTTPYHFSSKIKRKECEGKNDQQLTIQLSPKDDDDVEDDERTAVSYYRRRRRYVTCNTFHQTNRLRYFYFVIVADHQIIIIHLERKPSSRVSSKILALVNTLKVCHISQKKK